MKNKLVFIVVLIIVLVGGIITYKLSVNWKNYLPTKTTAQVVPSATNPSIAFDFGNQQVTLDNQQITLLNGAYIDPANGEHTVSISSSSVSSSGARGVAILVDNPGGSGTFYYLIGGMVKNGKAVYSTPVLLGDRIKILTANAIDPRAEDNGEIMVQYLDRPANVPMSSNPTVQTTKKFAFQNDGNLILVLH